MAIARSDNYYTGTVIYPVYTTSASASSSSIQIIGSGSVGYWNNDGTPVERPAKAETELEWLRRRVTEITDLVAA